MGYSVEVGLYKINLLFILSFMAYFIISSFNKKSCLVS